MGLRGPKPKSPELKLLEGNRSRRAVDASGVFRPDAGVPIAPVWLSQSAKSAWNRIAGELAQYNVLSVLDCDALAVLCQTIARVEEIETSFIARSSGLADPTAVYFDVTPNGLTVQSAYYQVLKREQEHLHKQLEAFGLRPDARSRVSIAAPVRAKLQSLSNADKTEAVAGFADFN